MTSTCAHTFEAGLCTQCLAPETDQDTQRSLNARDNADALAEHYSEVVGRYVDREDAIFLAWRSHRRRE